MPVSAVNTTSDMTRGFISSTNSATPGSGDPETGIPGQNVGLLRQSFIEGSNVEVVRELVSLITAQRAYEINSRAIQAGDEMLSNTAQLTR